MKDEEKMELVDFTNYYLRDYYKEAVQKYGNKNSFSITDVIFNIVSSYSIVFLKKSSGKSNEQIVQLLKDSLEECARVLFDALEKDGKLQL